jgi:glycosyltransferase involved in cell wall biosynthesis
MCILYKLLKVDLFLRENNMVENRFVIIMTAYNCAKYIRDAINSLNKQTYENWHCVIINDASTDDTETEINRNIPEIQFTVVHNTTNKGSVYNKSIVFYDAVKDWIRDEDIIVTLDGDDYLASDDVLEKLDRYYQDEKTWLTYGNFKCNVQFTDYGRDIDWTIPVRHQPFMFTHIRTSKWFLYKNIKGVDLRYGDGHFFTEPEDWVFMYPMAEMAGKEHVKFINEPLYFYRVHDGYHYADPRKKMRSDEVRMIIANCRPFYREKSKEWLIAQECDWYG